MAGDVIKRRSLLLYVVRGITGVMLNAEVQNGGLVRGEESVRSF